MDLPTRTFCFAVANHKTGLHITDSMVTQLKHQFQL